jgi:hypothetical protein
MGLETSSLEGSCEEGFLGCFFPPGATTLLFFPKASTVSLSASTLQKEAPRFFIMEGEIVGGTTSQPRQFLLAQAERLYPFS